MVMIVSNSKLQATLDKWDHMRRFGMNVPKYHLIYDDASLDYLFREFVTSNNLDRVNLLKFERETDDQPEDNLLSEVSRIKQSFDSGKLTKYYYLATEFIDHNDFVATGAVQTPTVDEPKKMVILFTKSYKQPEDVEDKELVKLDFEVDKDIPYDAAYLSDVKRISMGFPYGGCTLNWYVCKKKIGSLNTELCFTNYNV